MRYDVQPTKAAQQERQRDRESVPVHPLPLYNSIVISRRPIFHLPVFCTIAVFELNSFPRQMEMYANHTTGAKIQATEQNPESNNIENPKNEKRKIKISKYRKNTGWSIFKKYQYGQACATISAKAFACGDPRCCPKIGLIRQGRRAIS